jgi:hypothetical protein
MFPFEQEQHSRFVRIAKEYTASGKFLSTVRDLLTISGILYAFFYAWAGNSHTTFEFAETTSDLIKLSVTAKGPRLKPAYLRDVRMTFDGLKIEEARLRSASDDVTHTSMVVSPGEPVVVVLAVDGLRAKCRDKGLKGSADRYTKEELLEQIHKAHVTVTIYVQESNDAYPRFHFVRRTVPASIFEDFIRHNLPDKIPEASC